MSLITAEFQLNGFAEHHDPDIKSQSNGIRRPSSASSIERLEREFSAIMRPKSKTHDHDDDVDDEIVQEIRRRVLETTNRRKEQYDEIDIKWISETDDMIFRNILVFQYNHPKHKNTELMYNSVHDAVITTLKWRHDFGINFVRDGDIPKEFFQAKGVLFYIGTDGRFYVYIKSCKYRKFSSVWQDTCIRFAVHEIDKKIKEFSYKHKHGVYDLRPVIICDGHGTGMAQVDLKNFFIGRSIFTNHYPRTFKEVWIFGMPWWAKPFVTIALKALPAYVTDFVKLVDAESMIRDVGAENVPESLGGTMPEVYLQAPAITATVEQVGRQIGASRAEIKKLIEHLRSIAE